MFLTYHTVPKTYLAVQDRELVSDPTNRSARNGQNTKSFNVHKLLTTARDWHGPFTPAHGISQNRPKQSGLTIDILFYNRVDAYIHSYLRSRLSAFRVSDLGLGLSVPQK